MSLVGGTKIIKQAGEKLDKLEESVSQVNWGTALKYRNNK